MDWTNVAPLKGGYMITSIVGVVVSAIYVMPRSQPWGFTFAFFFALMFVASIISMTYGPEAAMLHAGHEVERKRKKKKK
jgi:type III secretory pathway component EscS